MVGKRQNKSKINARKKEANRINDKRSIRKYNNTLIRGRNDAMMKTGDKNKQMFERKATMMRFQKRRDKHFQLNHSLVFDGN